MIIEWIIAGVIAVLIAGGSFTGGVFTGMAMKPATNITYQYINQESQQTTETKNLTYSYQGQITIVSKATNFNLDMSLITNIYRTTNTATNFITKTNGK